MNNILDQGMIDKIISYGTFYKPAYLHYKDKNIKVHCDRCHMNELKECYGLYEYDLCINCIKECINIIIDEKRRISGMDMPCMKPEIFVPTNKIKYEGFPRNGYCQDNL